MMQTTVWYSVQYSMDVNYVYAYVHVTTQSLCTIVPNALRCTGFVESLHNAESIQHKVLHIKLIAYNCTYNVHSWINMQHLHSLHDAKILQNSVPSLILWHSHPTDSRVCHLRYCMIMCNGVPWHGGVAHFQKNCKWVSARPITNTDHRTTGHSIPGSLGDISWVQNAALQLYRKSVLLLHISPNVQVCHRTWSV